MLPINRGNLNAIAVVILWLALEYFVEIESSLVDNTVDKYNMLLLAQSGIFRRPKDSYALPKIWGCLDVILTQFTDA